MSHHFIPFVQSLWQKGQRNNKLSDECTSFRSESINDMKMEIQMKTKKKSDHGMIKCKHNQCEKQVKKLKTHRNYYCTEHKNDKYKQKQLKNEKNMELETFQQKSEQFLAKQSSQHYLTLFQRHSIIVLLAIGKNIKEIGEIIKCDQRTIKKWIRRSINNIELNLNDNHRSGRPTLLNEEEKTLIVARAAEDPFVTPSMIKIELDLHCSVRTIDRTLIEANLHGRVAMKSFPYSESEKQVRLSFANSMKSKSSEYWNKVLFTDESSLQLGLHHNRIYVRRPKGDYYKWSDKYVWKDETKISSGTVKFFGSFTSFGVGELYFYDSMNGKEFIKIINSRILPESAQFFNGEWFILHDNGKQSWRNVQVQNYVHSKGITQLNDGIWPSHSPDLNPIENLWSDLSSRVFDRNPCGLEELKEFTIEEWKQTDKELLKHLAFSMTKRCEEVIRNEGNRIKY